MAEDSVFPNKRLLVGVLLTAGAAVTIASGCDRSTPTKKDDKAVKHLDENAVKSTVTAPKTPFQDGDDLTPFCHICHRIGR